MPPKASIFFVPTTMHAPCCGIDDGVALLELHFDLTNRGVGVRLGPFQGRPRSSDFPTPSRWKVTRPVRTDRGHHRRRCAARRAPTTMPHRIVVQPGAHGRQHQREHHGLDADGQHFRVRRRRPGSRPPCEPRRPSASRSRRPGEQPVTGAPAADRAGVPSTITRRASGCRCSPPHERHHELEQRPRRRHAPVPRISASSSSRSASTAAAQNASLSAK